MRNNTPPEMRARGGSPCGHACGVSIEEMYLGGICEQKSEINIKETSRSKNSEP
jgi:hypothetical protein